jgi:hypothetical protein
VAAVATAFSAAEQVIAQRPLRPPAEVGVAQSAFQAGQVDSAIRTLEAFFRRNPTTTAGRLLFGNALARKGEIDSAIAVYRAITVPRPMRLQATFAIAALEARRGKTDEALELLRQLKSTGAFDMDLAQSNADFATLRKDSRFPSVLFHAEEYTNPFVEPVRVLHEWKGETKGDQFSWIARGVGDVDGDHVSDIVTSAPTFGANTQPTGRGKVYVYSGKSGMLLWQHTGEDGEALGIGLEGAGDVNHDGIPDVIAGAPGSGRAYVYSGKDGAVLLTLRGTTAEGYGSSAASAGDQNGDGYADVLVGAPSSSVAGAQAGRVYVISGRDGSLLATLDGEKAGDAFGSIVAGRKLGRATPILVGAPGGGQASRGRIYAFERLTTKPTHVFDADSTGAAFGGMFTSVVGDVNRDGTPDFYATDFANTAKGPATGRAYVYSGVDGHPLYTLTGENSGDGFGIGSADVGDVNRDGYDDLLIGAWQFSSVAPSGGKVYLYSGRDGSVLRSITGRIPGETLGFDATGVGDVDGDGVPDLLLTSSWSNVNGFRSGRMYLISGK